ncbi:MAG: exodeoxyribonuclease VII large subunit [Oscillospiraceae bacterium]|nr:exodeoxyribonuclease VII large subunit [Oscillospiraceae bacterium]
MSTVLTVSQINTYLKSVIEGDLNLRNIYISGEISNFTDHYRTGHFYFTLKDERSCLKAVMFRQAASRVRFRPEDGMKVLIRGSISVYERDGQYQLYCDDMVPEGFGELSLAYEQLKKKLEDLGLFRQEHKKPIPQMPLRVGVITSPTGAAVQDILNVLSRRFPVAEVVFEPVKVQGDGAALEIATAIDRFNQKRAADVLIVGRGGGSMEDLWAFNEEIVALAIYNSEIPVISAVGHETDFTIADFVSDLRAPTPSAAAELAVPDIRELLFAVDKTLDSLDESMVRITENYKMQILSAEKVIRQHCPLNTVELYRQLLKACEEKIQITVKNKLNFYENTLRQYAARLEGTSPLRVLSRGYAIVEDENGLMVKSALNLESGDNLIIKMSDADFSCEVHEILPRT